MRLSISIEGLSRRSINGCRVPKPVLLPMIVSIFTMRDNRMSLADTPSRETCNANAWARSVVITDILLSRSGVCSRVRVDFSSICPINSSLDVLSGVLPVLHEGSTLKCYVQYCTYFPTQFTHNSGSA